MHKLIAGNQDVMGKYTPVRAVVNNTSIETSNPWMKRSLKQQKLCLFVLNITDFFATILLSRSCLDICKVIPSS